MHVRGILMSTSLFETVASPALETVTAPALVTPKSLTSRRTMLKLAMASAGGVAIAALSSTTSSTRANAAVDTRDSLVLGAYRPDITTTGVLPGSTLTIVTSHVPVSNTTYTNLDVRCPVVPGASVGNVTYKNCMFRGPAAVPTGFSSMYTMFRPHQRGFTFIDCTFRPQTPNFRWVGLQGYGFTLKRCEANELVDQVEVFNTNNGPGGASDDSLRNGPGDVTIEQCFFHESAYWGPDIDNGAARNGSHSDCIQWEGTTGLTVRGNYFTGQLKTEYQPNYVGGTTNNSSMMIKPDAGAIGNATITDNWFGGGSVTINIADAPDKNRYISNLGTLSNNRFNRDMYYSPTAILAGVYKATGHTDISITATGNVFDSNNAVVPIIRKFY
jgi:hypothetical protein